MKKALFFSIIAAAFLAACGSSGGGGVTPPGNNGGGGNPSPSPSPTATPTNPPGAVTLTDQALEPIITSQLTTQFFLASLSNGLPPTTKYACNSQMVSRSYNPTTSPTGAIIQTTHYSQAGCPASSEVSQTTDTDVFTTSGSTTSVLDTRVTTNSNGTRNSTLQWMVASGGTGSFSALLGPGTNDTNGHSIDVAPATGGGWTLKISNATLLLGFNNGSGSGNCPQGGTKPACFQYGNTGTTGPNNATVTQSGNTYTYTGTHQETLYHGNSAGTGLALSPDPTLPACTTSCFQPFTISETNPSGTNLSYGTNSVDATITFDTAGNVLTAIVTATNSQTNPALNVSATLSASAGTITGKITTAQGNQPVGTFQTGLDGNGTLTANGTTYNIVNFIVQTS